MTIDADSDHLDTDPTEPPTSGILRKRKRALLRLGVPWLGGNSGLLREDAAAEVLGVGPTMLMRHRALVLACPPHAVVQRDGRYSSYPIKRALFSPITVVQAFDDPGINAERARARWRHCLRPWNEIETAVACWVDHVLAERPDVGAWLLRALLFELPRIMRAEKLLDVYRRGARRELIHRVQTAELPGYVHVDHERERQERRMWQARALATATA